MQRGLLFVNDEWPLQDHLPSKPIILTHWALWPRRPERTRRGFQSVANEWPFQDHLATTTIIATWSCHLGDLKNEWVEPGFISVTEEWPFQDHFPTKTIVLNQSPVYWEKSPNLCLSGDPDECAEASLCKWWMSFTSLSSQKAYCIGSTNSVSWRSERWMCRSESSAVSRMHGLSRPSCH